LHVTVGIIWLVTLMAQVAKRGLIAANPAAADVPVDVLALPST
jgi:heme/copper-type cytochrome/quinol oxidase subunit 3